MVLAVQAVALAALGVAGLVVGRGTSLFAHRDTTVLGLRLNLAHAALLLITGVVGGLVLLGSRTAVRRFAMVQALVFVLLFVFGTAFSAGRVSFTALDLDFADHVLHLALALVGFTGAYVLAAHILETGPTGPPPRDPDADADAPPEDHAREDVA